MLRIPITTSSHSYEALIEHGALSRAGFIVMERLGSVQPLFVVTVPPVRRRWGKTLLRSLDSAGFSSQIIEMRDGERFKRLATVEALAEALLRKGADRKAITI